MPNQNTGSIPNKYRIIGEIVEIFLFNNHVCIIDLIDLEKVKSFHWYAYKECRTFYARCNCYKNNKKVILQIHRFINNTPKGSLTDHINHNGLDNRRSNLRTANDTQNAINRRHIKKTSNSGYRGVFKSTYKTSVYYNAQISLNKKIINLGRFPSAIEAAKAYDKKAIEIHGEFSMLNFPRSNYAAD